MAKKDAKEKEGKEVEEVKKSKKPVGKDIFLQLGLHDEF